MPTATSARLVICLLLAGIVSAAPDAAGAQAPTRPRARDLGVAPGIFRPGHFNAITDVAGSNIVLLVIMVPLLY